MTILNIDKSYRLYRLVKPFYPNNSRELQPVQVIHQIIQSIEDINPSIYYRILYLLTGKEDKELDEMDSIDLLSNFIDGLRDNQILTLMGFWDNLDGN